VLSFVVLASATVAVTGCNHDTLRSGSEDLNVTYLPSPSGAGRYETAAFSINKIQFLPADPATAAIYGTERLQFRFDFFTADLTKTEEVSFTNIVLAAGTYRVTLIEFTRLSLKDSNVAPNPQTCIEGVAVLDGSQPQGQVPAKFAFNDPPDNLSDLIFTIRPGQTKLQLTVNVPGLIAGYESAYTCQLGCGSGGTPCLTAFNQAAFKAALLANVTFE
jgi:hypothetical protein